MHENSQQQLDLLLTNRENTYSEPALFKILSNFSSHENQKSYTLDLWIIFVIYLNPLSYAFRFLFEFGFRKTTIASKSIAANIHFQYATRNFNFHNLGSAK